METDDGGFGEGELSVLVGVWISPSSLSLFAGWVGEGDGDLDGWELTTVVVVVVVVDGVRFGLGWEREKWVWG